MKTSIIYGIIAALIAFFFMYLDTVLLDNPKTKTTYIKNMFLIGGIVGFGIHLIGEQAFEKIVSIERIMGEPNLSTHYSNNQQGGNNYTYNNSYNDSDLSEEIYTRPPNF